MGLTTVTRSLRAQGAVAEHQPVSVGELSKIFGLSESHAVLPFHTIGDTSPQYATALGLAVLAHLPAPEVDDLVAGGLDGRGVPITTDAAALHTDLRHVRDRGFAAVDQNRHRPGVCAVAAPVLDHHGVPLAAVSHSLPESRFDPGRLDALGQLVTDTGARITARHCG
ncbi:IclR family transcriptional regulator C-terminal domain-containing protein [Streptomyces massasporeus]|uniref:IclR family transcriptional regulator domain-containing protein n=1 Tax=Streptomyces massasporeus TaxID=67324 RepID=UPI003682E5ED